MNTPTAPTLRKRLYELGVALQAIVVSHGLISQEQSALWLAVGAALFNVVALVLARRNVENAPDAL